MSSMYKSLRLYFKNLWIDYYEVFKETRQSARKRPVRASIYGAATLFVLNMFRTNEGLRSYTSEVISACNKIGSVAENSRNPRSSQFVGQLGELNCHGLLRYNCPYLRPSTKEFFQERVVDLGVLGHWLFLELNMKDYDINEQLYEGLPETS